MFTRKILRTEAEVAGLCNRLSLFDRLGLDTESSGPLLVGLKGSKEMLNVYRSTLTGVSLALPSGESFYVPVEHRRGNATVPAVRKLARAVSEFKGRVAIHNAKHELLALSRNQHTRELPDTWTFKAISESAWGMDPGVRCTQVLAWLLASKASEKSPYGLKAQAKRFLGTEMSSFKDVVGDRDFSALTPEEGLDYACEDAEAALLLYDFYLPKLRAFPGLMETFEKVEIPFLFVLRHVEDAGMLLEPERHLETLEGLRTELDALVDEWDFLTPLSISSPKQLQSLYADGTWDSSGLDATAHGFATTREAIEEQLHRCKPGTLGHRLAEVKTRHSTVSKLVTAFGENLLSIAGQYDDGRLHSGFLHTGTDTGRLSCSYPNLQQIPKRTKEGKTLRQGFAAREGAVLLSADYSQIELRVLSHFAGKGPLYEGYLRGQDVHQDTAEALGVTRGQGKTTNFAVVYGVGPRKLGKKIGMSFVDCKDFLKRHREYHHDAMEVLEKATQAGSRRGYVRTFLHRFRPIDSARWAETVASLKDEGATYNGSEEFREAWFRKGREDRRAANTPIQGGAADIVKLAMIRMWRELDLTRTQIVCQIHDDIVQEPDEDYLAEAQEIQKDCMENAYKLRVPLVAEPASGKRWSDL